MEIKDLKELARRAFYWTSMSPDKRGEDTINDYTEDLRSFLASIPEQHHSWAKERYISKFRDWLSAKSRTFSVMITGASGFNNNRHAKANNREEVAYKDFTEWRAYMVKRLNRKEKLSLDAEFMETEQKIEELKQLQERMKEINKIVRSKKTSEIEKIDEIVAMGYTEESAMEIIKPDQFNRLGIPGYRLSNNNANIKHYEEKLEKLRTRLDARENGVAEREINGIRIIENVEADRLQLFFDGIPESKIRDELKKNGFKYAPTIGCWQTFLKSGKQKIKDLSFLVEEKVENTEVSQVQYYAFVVTYESVGFDKSTGEPLAPKMKAACQNFEEAVLICQAYISEYDLGGSTFLYGKIYHPFLGLIAYTSYNGRVWKGNPEDSSQERIEYTGEDLTKTWQAFMPKQHTIEEYPFDTLKTKLMELSLN